MVGSGNHKPSLQLVLVLAAEATNQANVTDKIAGVAAQVLCARETHGALINGPFDGDASCVVVPPEFAREPGIAPLQNDEPTIVVSYLWFAILQALNAQSPFPNRVRP